MALPVIFSETVTSDSDLSFAVEFAGEHHMSADHNEFIPSVPILNVKRFFSTNGSLFYSKSDSSFYMYDSTVMIRVHVHTMNVKHIILVDDGTFRSASYVEGVGLRCRIYDVAQKVTECDIQISDERWMDGWFGPSF